MHLFMQGPSTCRPSYSVWSDQGIRHLHGSVPPFSQAQQMSLHGFWDPLELMRTLDRGRVKTMFLPRRPLEQPASWTFRLGSTLQWRFPLNGGLQGSRGLQEHFSIAPLESHSSCKGIGFLCGGPWPTADPSRILSMKGGRKESGVLLLMYTLGVEVGYFRCWMPSCLIC